FLDALNSRLQTAKEKEILLFVHGYNNTLVSSVTSAVVLSSASKFAGVPVVFSWPSEGSAPRYPADEEEVKLSRDTFVEFVRLIKRTDGLKRLHLITHSMGGRLAVAGPEWLNNHAEARPIFHHVVFAAPDVFTTDFDSALPS